MDANSMEYELSVIDLHNALSITSFTYFIKCDHKDEGGYGDEDDLSHQNEGNHTFKEEEQ